MLFQVLSPRRSAVEEALNGGVSNEYLNVSQTSPRGASSSTTTAPGIQSATSSPAAPSANTSANLPSSVNPNANVFPSRSNVIGDSSSKDAFSTPPSTQPEVVPPFYFPKGTPPSNMQTQQMLSQIRDAFEKLPNRKANKFNIQSIMRVSFQYSIMF